MGRSYFSAWPALGLASVAVESTMLAFEAQQVIALRLAKMALGGAAAQKEAQLMVTEKLAAAAQAGTMMMAGAAAGRKDLHAGKVVRMVRRKVRANHQRLSRSRRKK